MLSSDNDNLNALRTGYRLRRHHFLPPIYYNLEQAIFQYVNYPSGCPQYEQRYCSRVARKRCGEGWLSLPSLVEGCREGVNPAGMNSYGDRLHFSKRIAVLNS